MPSVFANPSAVATELWVNGRDSLVHALDHFSERNREHSDRQHHDKWIAMSVHHAAECIVNMRLLTLAPAHQIFSRQGSPYFPSLRKSLALLQEPNFSPQPTRAEQKLFELLTSLIPIRDSFMHRMIPVGWDVSPAAMCMIGLLKYAERLRGEAASDLVWQGLPVERDVMEAVHYRHVVAYCDFAGLFVAEKYPNKTLHRCPACEVCAIADDTCEACYEDLDSVSCPDYQEPAYYMTWQARAGHITHVDCPHCNSRHRI